MSGLLGDDGTKAEETKVHGKINTLPKSVLSNKQVQLVIYPILPCSVKSPSLCRIAVSILRVELPDLLWLFFTPSNHLTISFMPWI